MRKRTTTLFCYIFSPTTYYDKNTNGMRMHKYERRNDVTGIDTRVDYIGKQVRFFRFCLEQSRPLAVILGKDGRNPKVRKVGSK